MSGGAAIPKAPDLSGNIASANDTAKQATGDATQQFNTAQAYNTNAQSNLQNVTAQNNSMAGQIGANATTNLNTYGSTFVPLQQQQANQALQYGSQENIQKQQGMATANVNAANQAARSNSAAALASEGVDPASIHGGALDRQAGVAAAGQVAGAGTQSALNTQNQAINLTNQANQLGLQVNNQGTAGAATAAGVSDQGQSTLNSTNASGISNLGASANYLNSSTSANNGAVGANQVQFGDQMQEQAAQQAQQNSTITAIGSVAGGAMTFMEGGGVVPHSGLPVRAGHVGLKTGIPLHFQDMAVGGKVPTAGALPVGAIPGTTDRKPAMLTPGEFVVPHDVVQHKGHEFFHKLIDKTREEANTRRAIPVPHQPHMSMH
jgi:hypothetical protein